MKWTMILCMMAAILFAGCRSTQQDPQKAAKKEARKAVEAAEGKAWFDRAVQALKDREFVLEADRIDFKRGRFAYVTANTNFVSMHGNKATIQLAFNTPYAGPNGLGGITVDGTASNVKMTTDKKGNITFNMMVQGVAVSANVTLRIMEGTNRCTAIVTPNFNSNRITFSGILYSESEANIFKGRSI